MKVVLFLIAKVKRRGLPTSPGQITRKTFNLSNVFTLASDGNNRYARVTYNKNSLRISNRSTFKKLKEGFISLIPLSTFN